MGQNKDNICLLITASNEKSKKFFNPEGLKLLNSFLQERAPAHDLLSVIQVKYHLPPINHENIPNVSEDPDPEVLVHSGATMAPGYDNTFIITFYQYKALFELTTIMKEPRKFVALPQLNEFFRTNKISVHYFEMASLE